MIVMRLLLCDTKPMLENTYLENIPESHRAFVASMHNVIVTQQEEINRLRRALYGAKSEKHKSILELLVPQGTLFNEAESGASLPALEPEATNTEPAKKQKRSPESGGRKPLPNDLPRERVIHDVEEGAKVCPHDGANLVCIGEEVVEVLEFVPAQLKVVENVYPKYACNVCEGHVAKAPAAPSVLPQTQCGPGLLAQIIICKFLLAMPLYRQETEFEQMGIPLARTSMARWVIGAQKFLSPVIALLKDFILSRDALHADETTVQVLKEAGKTPQSKSYMWVICTTEHDPPAVYYEYHDNRSASAAAALLDDFEGVLHVDGYRSYGRIAKKEGVLRVGCWAHVRRKFDVAKKDGAAAGKPLASQFLDLIQKLFLLERQCNEFSQDERLKQRREIAAPIVSEIKALLEKSLIEVTPKSKLGLALAYLNNEWDSLTAYVEEGRASISNNRVENLIRPFAIGRKNWLFADTPDGAHASAGLYSLLLSAKANDIEARAYLISLFTELPVILSQNPSADLSPYLPWNWKKTLVPQAPC